MNSLARYAATPASSRQFATVASTYPFAKNAIVLPSTSSAQPRELLLKGRGLMQHLKKTLPLPEAQQKLETLFSKNNSERLHPGSVLSVTMQHAPHTFSGVLIGVRHKGPDTSFVLRNVIHRTGVEMRFCVGSPALKDIQIIHRAGTGVGRRVRRAKLFYLRDQPAKMTAISASIKRTQS